MSIGNEHETTTPATDDLTASRRRWAILVVAVLVTTIGMFNQLAVSALGPQVTELLGVSSAQLASVMTAPLLGGVIFGLIAGGLTDRYGVKKVVTVAFLGSLVGAGLRIVADTYVLFFVAMFLIGLSATVLNSCIAKLLGGWFSANRVGTAMGIYMMGGSLGAALALATVARFPSTLSVWVSGAVLIALAFVLWLVIVKEPPSAPGQESPAAQSLGSALAVAARNPHVWLLGLGMALFLGSQLTFSSFLPTALNADKGVNLATAGVYAAVFTIGALIGSLVVPPIAAIGGRNKPVIVIAALLSAASMVLAWMTAPSPVIVVFLFLAGAPLGGIAALLMAAPALLASVTPASVGSAGGLISTLQMAGGFIIPTFVVAPIAGTNYTLLLTLAAVCAGLISVVVAFVPEYGHAAHQDTSAAHA